MPPFTITNQMLMLVAEIAEKTGNISNFHSFETKPHLRRNNRIRSIHSSLAIEANSLSLDEVRSVISGKTVIGPQKEIQEVKNAYRAYEQIGRFDPYSLDDLKRLHGIMTHLTVQESGAFRSHNEGVFKTISASSWLRRRIWFRGRRKRCLAGWSMPGKRYIR